MKPRLHQLAGAWLALSSWACAVSSRHIVDPMRSDEPPVTRPYEDYFLPRIASWGPRPLSPALREPHAQRPTLTGSLTFDFQALPILGPVSDGEAEVTVHKQRLEVVAAQDAAASLVAELSSLSRSQFTVLASPAPLGLATAGPTRPLLQQLQQPQLLEPLCGPHSAGAMPATLRGFTRETWSPAGLDFGVYSGVLHGCAGTLSRTHAVRARALIPGTLYAFRSCRSGCDTEGGVPVEELTILGPPADWVSSSSHVSDQLQPHVGSFTWVSVPIRPGSSAVVTMHVTVPDLGYFLSLPGTTPDWAAGLEPYGTETLAFTVEVAWLTSAAHADGVVYVSTVHPASARTDR